MGAEPKHRDAILAAAATLFRQRGFAATGMNDIVAESGAPKGSVYYYFPQGKVQIGAEALAYAGRHLETRIRTYAEAESDPAVFLRGIIAASAETLEKSGFRNGCPIAGVLLDTPQSETRIMRAADNALVLWRGLIEQVCTRAGIPQVRAAFVASVAISALEGSLMQARAAGDTAPMTAAGEALGVIVSAELQSVRDGELH